MTTNFPVPDYQGFRYPAEIISHAVWLYFRFSASVFAMWKSRLRSTRDCRELCAQSDNGVCAFGQSYANELRYHRSGGGDKWHLGRGSSLPSVVRDTPCGERWISMATCWICGSQSRRNTKAAKRFFRKLLKGLLSVPRVIITDKLKSYGVAKREILPGVEHRQHKRREYSRGKLAPTDTATRAENAHIQIGRSRPTLSALAFGPIYEHAQSAAALYECSGLPCHFTESISSVKRG